MSLTAGARIGPYEIVSLLGAGGMGEVYRARDARLGRDVAIKVLPEAFANDAERLARFQREAQLLASLNHPHIAIIHGLEESAGSRALVMELVEGPTLADRIAQGPIPVDEALPIARQIAEALEAAHERGVIHRDLKPANIKVTPDGNVKVLDFGLAKLVEPDGTDAGSLTMSPTLSVQATGAGLILGTAAYMSPEQARGRPVDRRTDIWAFGCVLFEMLTGQQAFETGETVSDAVAAILKNEPNWRGLPVDIPAHITALLRRCLQKDVQKRLPHVGVARLDLESDALIPSFTEPLARPIAGRERVVWASVAAAAAILSAAAVWAIRPASTALEMRLEVNTPPSANPLEFALSPDGQLLVYAASDDAASRLWLRPLAVRVARPLAGTEGADAPFWSPDSRSIGFFAGGALKRIDLGGGQPRTLTTPAAPAGGTWNSDGVILFRRTFLGGPLSRVPADGAEALPVTTLNGQTTHSRPYFLPDGRQFLFRADGTPETRGLYLGSLDSADTTRLLADDVSRSAYAEGWLLWVLGGSLRAQRLDLARRELVGNQITLAESAGAVSVSTAGAVAYRGASAVKRQLRWFGRTGSELGALGATEDEGTLDGGQRVSPDGRRVAVRRTLQDNEDIWILEGARTSRFTFDTAYDRNPVWSPDGREIMFQSNRSGIQNLYTKLASGGGPETLVLASPLNKVPSDWSSDGRFVLYHSLDPDTQQDLWVLPLDGDRKPWLLLKTTFNERHGDLSPDGRWVAYMSNESGRSEIYVRSFAERRLVDPAGRDVSASAAETAGQWQISTSGGIFPRWAPDGRELYYIGPEGHLMATPITTVGNALEPGQPVALFETRIAGGGEDVGQGPQFDVTSDGRFLINTEVEEAADPITLLLNWRPEGR